MKFNSLDEIKRCRREETNSSVRSKEMASKDGSVGTRKARVSCL